MDAVLGGGRGGFCEQLRKAVRDGRVDAIGGVGGRRRAADRLEEARVRRVGGWVDGAVRRCAVDELDPAAWPQQAEQAAGRGDGGGPSGVEGQA